MTETAEMNQTKKESRKVAYSFWAMLIGALMLMATLFAPFASAKDGHREYLEKYSDSRCVEELDMENEEAIHISLFEFARIYSVTAELDMSKDISIACMIIIIAFAVLAILTLLFSILKKPIVAIIFDLLTLGVFIIIKWDFEDRGVIPSSSYDWGIAQYIAYTGIVSVMIGAMAFIVGKMKEKKQRKILEQ